MIVRILFPANLLRFLLKRKLNICKRAYIWFFEKSSLTFEKIFRNHGNVRLALGVEVQRDTDGDNRRVPRRACLQDID